MTELLPMTVYSLWVAMVREKYRENKIFSRSGKSQGILWMVRGIMKGETSGNLKINGYGRQTSENLIILFKGEKMYFLLRQS